MYARGIKKHSSWRFRLRLSFSRNTRFRESRAISISLLFFLSPADGVADFRSNLVRRFDRITSCILCGRYAKIIFDMGIIILCTLTRRGTLHQSRVLPFSPPRRLEEETNEWRTNVFPKLVSTVAIIRAH